jgi:hypothetical protein
MFLLFKIFLYLLQTLYYAAEFASLDCHSNGENASPSLNLNQLYRQRLLVFFNGEKPTLSLTQDCLALFYKALAMNDKTIKIANNSTHLDLIVT